MSFPQPQHYQQKKLYKEKRNFLYSRWDSPFLASMTQLARIEWVPQSVSCCRVRRETTDRGSREDCPLPGIHLAVRWSELGPIALHTSGRRYPSLKSHSLTATFYLRQGWSCHKSHVLYPWLVHLLYEAQDVQIHSYPPDSHPHRILYILPLKLMLSLQQTLP